MSLTSSESEEVVVSFDLDVLGFFKLILSVRSACIIHADYYIGRADVVNGNETN